VQDYLHSISLRFMMKSLPLHCLFNHCGKYPNSSFHKEPDQEESRPKNSAVFQTSPLVPVTPLKVYLRDHFATVLQQSRPAKQRQKGQVKPREYGEVLTADEGLKKKKRNAKRRREKRRHRGVHRAVQLKKESRGSLKMKKKKVIMVH